MTGGDQGDDGDDLLFAEEASAADTPAAPASAPWIVLIADDDPEVHAITRMVLGEVVFDGRRIEFLSAHSGSEAKRYLGSRDDIAVVLLDVVMETDDAGLRLARFIREDLGNRVARIILRTGQPGQAPERHVILTYDINDYKAKSELTAQKLLTATVAALRSYQHIAAIESGRRGLEAIVDAADSLFGQTAPDVFERGVVARLGVLVPDATGILLCGRGDGGSGEALAGAGRFDGARGPLGATLSADRLADVRHALNDGTAHYGAGFSIIPFRSRNEMCFAIYVEGHERLGGLERRLIELFCSKVALGFDNLSLYGRLANAERATVHALGRLAEFKDEATGDHVRRVGNMSSLIALELRGDERFPEIDDEFCALIGLASMLHDVGKVGIPDSILRKPGTLEPGELSIMRGHARIGGTILAEAAAMVGGRSYLSLGAEIADCHHEKFDGTGYPNGLAGDGIPVAARIVAVADVYDALMHSRPYKQAWDSGTVIDLIRRESGRHFDPRMVDAFLIVLSRQQTLL